MVVIRHYVKRKIVQQLAKTAKPYIVNKFRDQYGEIVGLAVGTAISIGIQDYSGAFRDFEGYFKGRGPDRKTPPFGYLNPPGRNGLNGSPGRSQYKTLRSVSNRPNHVCYSTKHCDCRRRGKYNRKLRYGSRGGKYR